MLLVIRPKLTRVQAENLIADLVEWFANNPRRRVCRLGEDRGSVWFVVHKHSIEADVLAHTDLER